MKAKTESKRGAYVKVKGNLLFPDVFDKCVNLAMTFSNSEDREQSKKICSQILQELKAQPLTFTFMFSQSCTFIVNPLADLIVEEQASNSTSLELGYNFLNSGITREAASSFFFKCFDVLMSVLEQHHGGCDDDEFPLYAAKIMCTAIHIVDEVELVAKGIVKSSIFWHSINVRLQAAHPGTPQVALVALLYLARQCLSAVPITRAIIADVESVLKCATACARPFSNDVIRCLAALFIVLSLSTEEDITSLSATLPKLAVFTCNATSKENLYMATVFRLAEELMEDKGNACYLRRINSAFSELKKRSFHTQGRLRSLERISGLLFYPEEKETDSHTACVSTAAVVLIPGAVRVLFSAICDVDEFTCGCACDIFSKLLIKTPHGDKGTSDIICSVQLSVVQSLIEMGIIYLLEDILADYSVRATVSVLSLLTAFVKFSSVSKAAVTSSRCVQRVVHSIHQLAQKDNLEEYISKDERSTQVTLYFELLSLTLGEEKTTVPESVLTDISTIISEAKSVALGQVGMRTLAKLASLYPMAASLVLDFDFLNEVLVQEGVVPTVLHRMLIEGSFGIMAEMVCVEDSVVTFEWIETLLAAVRRVGDWDDAGLFTSVWTCVAKTLNASEEAREYMMDDETCDILERNVRSVVEKIEQGENDCLVCLSPLVESALCAPCAVGERILHDLLSRHANALPSTVSSILEMCSRHQEELPTPLWATTLMRCLRPEFVVGAADDDLCTIRDRTTSLISSNAEQSMLFSLQLFQALLQKEELVDSKDGLQSADAQEATMELDSYVEAVDAETLTHFVKQIVDTTTSSLQCNTTTGAAVLSETVNLLNTLERKKKEGATRICASLVMQAFEMCIGSFAWAKAADVKAAAPLEVDMLADLFALYASDATNPVSDAAADDAAKFAQFCSDLISLGFISEVDFAENSECKMFVEKYIQPFIEQNEICHTLVLKLNATHV